MHSGLFRLCSLTLDVGIRNNANGLKLLCSLFFWIILAAKERNTNQALRSILQMLLSLKKTRMEKVQTDLQCALHVDSFLSKGSNLLEWALGSTLNAVLRATKKAPHAFWIIACWCFANVHHKGIVVIHYIWGLGALLSPFSEQTADCSKIYLLEMRGSA